MSVLAGLKAAVPTAAGRDAGAAPQRGTSGERGAEAIFGAVLRAALAGPIDAAGQESGPSGEVSGTARSGKTAVAGTDPNESDAPLSAGGARQDGGEGAVVPPSMRDALTQPTDSTSSRDAERTPSGSSPAPTGTVAAEMPAAASVLAGLPTGLADAVPAAIPTRLATTASPGHAVPAVPVSPAAVSTAPAMPTGLATSTPPGLAVPAGTIPVPSGVSVAPDAASTGRWQDPAGHGQHPDIGNPPEALVSGGGTVPTAAGSNASAAGARATVPIPQPAQPNASSADVAAAANPPRGQHAAVASEPLSMPTTSSTPLPVALTATDMTPPAVTAAATAAAAAAAAAAVPVPVPVPATAAPATAAPATAVPTTAAPATAAPATAVVGPGGPATGPAVGAAPQTTISAGDPGASVMPAPFAPLQPAAALPVAPVPQSLGAPLPAPVPLASQISGPLGALATAKSGEHLMTVHVAPDALGPVTVRAHISADNIRIELYAPNNSGRDALRAALPELKRDLAATGMNASLDLASGNQPDGREPADRTAATSTNPARRGHRQFAPPGPEPGIRYTHTRAGSTLDVIT